MIVIEVIRTHDGVLMGRRFQDRWNLDSLGSPDFTFGRLAGPIGWLSRKGQVDAYRRRLRGLGFVLRVMKGCVVEMTDMDVDMFRSPPSGSVTQDDMYVSAYLPMLAGMSA